MEPKLNFVFTVDDMLSLFSLKEQSFEKCGGTRKKRFVPKRSCGDRLSLFLGDVWTVMDYAIFGGEAAETCGTSHTATTHLLLVFWPLRIIARSLYLFGLSLCLATFGLLWPPQIQRWLFRPSRSSIRNSREANAAAEYSATQACWDERRRVTAKGNVIREFNDMKRDILELKRLLYDAMEE